MRCLSDDEQNVLFLNAGIVVQVPFFWMFSTLFCGINSVSRKKNVDYVPECGSISDGSLNCVYRPA